MRTLRPTRPLAAAHFAHLAARRRSAAAATAGRMLAALAACAVGAVVYSGAAVAGARAVAVSPPGSTLLDPVDRRWLTSAEALVNRMLAATAETPPAAGSLPAARALLANPQSLFGFAIEYGVFSSCSSDLRMHGSPRKALRALETAVRVGCVPLVRASDAFLRGVRAMKPHLLLVAEKDAAAGIALMRSASARLAAFRKANP